MSVLARTFLACLTGTMMRLFYLIGLAFVASLAHGVELIGEPQVVVIESNATLRWKTDVACGTRVSYGLSADKLDQKVEGAVTAEHEVRLTDLKAGTTYHYSLGSARQRLHIGSLTVTGKSGDTAAAAPPAAKAPIRKSILEKMREVFEPAPKADPKTPSGQVQARAPPTRETWGRMDSLQDHFDRHGADFESRNADDYAAQAWKFLQRGKAGGLLMKWDEGEGTLRLFDPQTRAFAAYNRDGTTKTFFRPSNPSYWQRQPGLPIKPADLPF